MATNLGGEGLVLRAIANDIAEVRRRVRRAQSVNAYHEVSPNDSLLRDYAVITEHRRIRMQLNMKAE